MNRTALACAALIASLLTPSGVAAAPIVARAQAAGQLTALDAAPFIGEWTLTMEGANGPATFELSVKAENDKVTGEIAGGATAPQAIAEISKAGQSLLLSYTFDYQGNSVDAVVKLTPGAEGKMAAQIDFASGAYVVTGSAAKKVK